MYFGTEGAADLTQTKKSLGAWTASPRQSIQYTSCHDGYTLYDLLCINNPDDVTAVTVETTNKDKQKGLLCYRDSFGNSLIPFLANEFKHCTFSKSAIYSIDRLAASDYDVCIIEVVERNITNLVKFAPVMPAPLRRYRAVCLCEYR